MDILNENEKYMDIFQQTEKFMETMNQLNDELKIELKTSHEWYTSLPVQNIVDPDGWRDLTNGGQGLYWHTEFISWSEFYKRHRKCTMTRNLSKIPSYPYFESLEKWKKENYV